MQEKVKWSENALKKWGSFAKLAYLNDVKAGFIQYRPVSEERIVQIDCIFVPRKEFWQKGIATKLLNSLIKDVKENSDWFENKPARALVTKTFQGQGPDQYSARQFFRKKGFVQINDDPDFLYLPLKKEFVYQPSKREKPKYEPRREDQGRIIIVCGPSFCPVTYPYFLKTMERYIKEVTAKTPIRWLDVSKEPEEARKRNVDVGNCIVNAKLIKSFAIDKKNFQKEIKEALR